MGNIYILGVMSPIVSLFCSATFFILWWREKETLHLLSFCISFALCSFGVLVSHFLIPEMSYANLLVSMSLYALGTAAYFWGLCNRIESKPPLTLMGITTVLGMVIACILTAGVEDVFFRFYASMLTVAVLFIIGTRNFRQNMRITHENKAIILTCLAVIILLILSPLIGRFFDPLMNGNIYNGSLQWTLTIFFVNICVVALSVWLILAHSKDLLERLKSVSQQDFLTGLKNRQGYEDGFDSLLADSKEKQLPTSVIIADIDNFKNINDVYGHQMGDRVIKAIGGIVSKVARDCDVAGRVGGEEFSLVLWNTDEAVAILVAKQICTTFSELSDSTLPAGINHTASIGVTCSHDSSLTKAELYSQADKALYRAKLTGKNKVCVHQETQRLNIRAIQRI